MTDVGIIDFKIYDPPDPLAKLPALAKRLGVLPTDMHTGPPSTYLTTKSGESYDLFDLVNAVLDRLDIVTQDRD